MNNKLVFDQNTGKARHVHRSETLRRHRRHSHAQGECVQFIGNDKKERGLGIVIAETTSSGSTYEEIKHIIDNPRGEWEHVTPAYLKDELFTHLKVFWQNLAMEEVVPKSHVKKVPDRTTGVVVKKK